MQKKTVFVLLIISFFFQFHTNGINSRGLAEQHADPVDSLFSKLIDEDSDSILIYYECKDGNEKTGIVSWSNKTKIFANLFTVNKETPLIFRKNALLKDVIDVRKEYFKNQEFIADTLPKFAWNGSDDFEITFQSYLAGIKRKLSFTANQILFGSFLISRIGMIFSKVTFELENGK